MTSVARPTEAHDVTDLPAIVFGAIRLGLLEAGLVLLFSIAMRALEGPAELLVCGIILAVGLAAVSLLPGIWTRALTIEGIAGAAGIGLGAAFVFLLVDVALLQNIGTYTNRWHAIGGSNWWYHPVWWMVGTFMPWMGAWTLANQATRRGEPAPAVAFGMALIFSLLAGALGVAVGVPRAGWNLATFGVAFLPGVVIATLVSGLGTRRRSAMP